MSAKKFTIVSACMNRSAMLRVSLQSWIGNPLISEIIIIDWSSKDPISWAESLDPRIRVIRIDGQKTFNKSKSLNIGISASSGDFIMQMDVDYILNPYYNLVEVFQKKNNRKGFHSMRWMDWRGERHWPAIPATNQWFSVRPKEKPFRSWRLQWKPTGLGIERRWHHQQTPQIRAYPQNSWPLWGKVYLSQSSWSQKAHLKLSQQNPSDSWKKQSDFTRKQQHQVFKLLIHSATCVALITHTSQKISLGIS